MAKRRDEPFYEEIGIKRPPKMDPGKAALTRGIALACAQLLRGGDVSVYAVRDVLDGAGMTSVRELREAEVPDYDIRPLKPALAKLRRAARETMKGDDHHE